MGIMETNWTPSDRQLRQFGIICGIALPGVGWIWAVASSVAFTLAAIGFVIAVLGLIAPRSLKYLFLTLMVAAAPIGMLIGELALLLIYYGLFLPTGFAFRLLRRDALQMKLDREVKSYWRAKKQPRNAASYYHQS